jgi:NAD+ synthase (glutamine-hydrolysing)
MKIALAQINPKIGDLNNNTQKIIANIEKAKTQNVDLIVFSELSITGYSPFDLLDFESFVQDNLTCLDEIKAHTNGIGVIVGFVDFNENDKGKKYRNSAALIYNGEIITKYNKMLLPYYDVFHETRYFEPGEDVCVVDFCGEKIGLTICEDLWNDKSSFDRQKYLINPVEELAQYNPDLVINLSASPYVLNKEQKRIKITEKLAKKYSVPFAYINQIGANDDLIFDGSSFVMGKDGQIKAQCKDFEEDFILFDTKTQKGEIHPNTDQLEGKIVKAVTMGLRDYCKKIGFKKVILGLSGGIDSALTAYLAKEALGAENVLCITMPSKYSSSGSVKDSEDLAKNIGVELKNISIKPMFDVFKHQLGDEVLSGLAEENLQARLRANILMSYSNRYGHLLLSTGNKSELAVGYCTIYGDMSGGINLISDLPKTLVYKVSRYINKEKEIIPWAIIDKAPSAELRPDQKDQDSLPEYDVLDDIIEDYVVLNKAPEAIYKKHQKETVDDIIAKITRAEYKRRQATLGLKLTSKAFGSGRKIPISQGYKH